MSDQTLAAAVERLEAAYETARQSMAEENARCGRPYAPEEMREASGRYILLDALTAIVQAKAALACTEAPVEALVVRPGDTLILRLGQGATPEMLDRIKRGIEPAMKERSPGLEVLWVGGVEQMAVYRPEGEPV